MASLAEKEDGRCKPRWQEKESKASSKDEKASRKSETVTDDAIAHLKFPKKHKPVFVDAKAMKEKLRQNMHKPRYDVTNFYKDTGFAQEVARNPIFEHVTLSVIAFNALWISIDCDVNTAEVITAAHPVFIFAENAFCLFFSVELTFRFLAFKHKRNCLKDAWFVFDSFMVAMMVFETWLMTIVILIVGGGSSSGMGNASLLRLLRLLRLSRMARMARLLRSMPELLVLIKGMIAAIRSVFFTLLLLFLLLYIFAILFRQLTVDSDLGEDKFPTIPTTIQTLVLDGILFDGPGDLMAAIEEESMYILVVVYYVFVLLAALTVMNMLIGVLCEVVSATAATEREELTIVYVRERLQAIVDRCCQLNKDGELKLGKKDFLGILQDAEATQLLLEVQVDVFGIVDLVDTIFATETGAERVLEFGDLIEVFLDQRTSNTATVKDVTDLRKYVRGRLDLLESNVEVQMAALGSMMESTGTLAQGTFDYEMQRRRKAHGLALQEGEHHVPQPPPPPPKQTANPEVVPEVAGSAPEVQAPPQTIGKAATQPDDFEDEDAANNGDVGECDNERPGMKTRRKKTHKAKRKPAPDSKLVEAENEETMPLTENRADQDEAIAGSDS